MSDDNNDNNMAQNDMGVEDTSSSSFTNVINDILYNPINLILLAVCLYLLYKIFSSRKQEDEDIPRTPELPPMRRHDMTYQELRNYDGNNEEGRLCVGVNGKVFDVTKGKQFYGPGGPYASFAGRDASRCLATFSVEGAKDEYDDLSDLNPTQMDSVREWEIQFQERYHYVGRLLRPGEEPADYSDEEEANQDNQNNQDLPGDPPGNPPVAVVKPNPSPSKKDE